MAERIIQRVVFPIGDRPAALYYRSTESVANVDRFSVHLRSGSRLSADTYFNTFFENYWHLHTTVRKVSLHLEVEGTGTVRLLRRTGGQTIAVAAKSFSCPGERIALDLPTACVRDAGLVHFDLTAGSEGVYLHRAEWVAEDVEAETIRLVVGCCTFDREAALFATLRSLFADIGLKRMLESSRGSGSRPALRSRVSWIRRDLCLERRSARDCEAGELREAQEASRAR